MKNAPKYLILKGLKIFCTAFGSAKNLMYPRVCFYCSFKKHFWIKKYWNVFQKQSDDATKAKTENEPKSEDYSDVVNDPQFLQSVLYSLFRVKNARNHHKRSLWKNCRRQLERSKNATGLWQFLAVRIMLFCTTRCLDKYIWKYMKF